MVSPAIPQIDASTDGRPTGARDDDAQRLLHLLGDDVCREILWVTRTEARSASEIADACGLPLSTTYRKLDRLTAVGLLSMGIRLRRSGKHAREYVCDVDDVHLSVAPAGGFEVVLRHNGSTAGSVEGFGD